MAFTSMHSILLLSELHYRTLQDIIAINSVRNCQCKNNTGRNIQLLN